MPRKDAPRPLTLAFVRHVKEPGKYYDQDGLILTVSPGGGKSWMQRLTIQGRRRDIGLGSAHVITPSQARRMAAKNREISRSGENPLSPRPDNRRTPNTEPRAITFSRFTLNRYRRHLAESTGLTLIKKDRSRILRLVVPALGRMPMTKITAEDIQGVLKNIAKENVNSADAVRRQLGLIFDEAIADRIRDDNPARNGEIIVPRRRKRKSLEGDTRNRRLLEEFPNLLRVLEETGRRPSLVLQIRFCLLTLRNTKECRLARWEQIDLERRLWKFPSMQVQGADAVEVSLHDGLLELLKVARLLSKGDGKGWVFPSPLNIDEPYSANAAYNVFRELGFKIEQRDFRRVYEYWAERHHDANGLFDWYSWLASDRR